MIDVKAHTAYKMKLFKFIVAMQKKPVQMKPIVVKEIVVPTQREIVVGTKYIPQRLGKKRVDSLMAPSINGLK